MSDKYVFHSIMSNQLSDRHPDRGVLNTLHTRLSSTPTPFAGHLVGRMQYAPYPAGRKIGFEGLAWDYVWDKGRFFDKEDEKREDFLAGG